MESEVAEHATAQRDLETTRAELAAATTRAEATEKDLSETAAALAAANAEIDRLEAELAALRARDSQFVSTESVVPALQDMFDAEDDALLLARVRPQCRRRGSAMFFCFFFVFFFPFPTWLFVTTAPTRILNSDFPQVVLDGQVEYGHPADHRGDFLFAGRGVEGDPVDEACGAIRMPFFFVYDSDDDAAEPIEVRRVFFFFVVVVVPLEHRIEGCGSHNPPSFQFFPRRFLWQ